MAEGSYMKMCDGIGETSLDNLSKLPTPAPGVRPNPLIDDLIPHQLNRGVLIPMKTTQEVRQDHTIVQAYITRAPTKSANEVIW